MISHVSSIRVPHWFGTLLKKILRKFNSWTMVVVLLKVSYSSSGLWTLNHPLVCPLDECFHEKLVKEYQLDDSNEDLVNELEISIAHVYSIVYK